MHTQYLCPQIFYKLSALSKSDYNTDDYHPEEDIWGLQNNGKHSEVNIYTPDILICNVQYNIPVHQKYWTSNNEHKYVQEAKKWSVPAIWPPCKSKRVLKYWIVTGTKQCQPHCTSFVWLLEASHIFICCFHSIMMMILTIGRLPPL